MTHFTIRVELHDAKSSDYASLAEDLSAIGITDIIVGDDGSRWKMPPAEYNYTGSLTLEQVYSATSNVTQRLGKKFAVLVTEADGRKWGGLARA